jgi:superfamily II DNA or RNA helicase
MNSIYVYTTETYREKSWYKIGQTKLDPHVRVKQQDGTGSPEPLILLESWLDEGKGDKAFHAHLDNKGFGRTRGDATREWFFVLGGMTEIKAQWNLFTKGIKRPNKFDLRPEQLDCVEKAFNYLMSNPACPFLIDAKMRFGKCITSYKLAEKLLASKSDGQILVVTSKPSVAESWLAEHANHVDFDGWGWKHIGHPEKDIAASPGKPTVTFVSMQMLICGGATASADNDELYDEEARSDDDVDGTLAAKLNKTDIIYSTRYDLLIVDEVHYGTQTVNAKAIFDAIGRDHTVYLSGTPYKRLQSGEFGDENTSTWSYSDEQEAKDEDQRSPNPTGIYDMLPKMWRVLPDLTKAPGLKNLIQQFSDDEGFAIEKMFGVNKVSGRFFEEATVINFLDVIKKNGTARGFSPWGMKSSERFVFDVKMLDHTMWFLPSVDAISALAKLLRSHTGFFGNFDIIETSGPTQNVTGIVELQNRLKANSKGGKQTIILACERFKEGITLPELGAVFFLNGWKSPESYYQASFRCQSPWTHSDPITGKIEITKKNCYVFDFNPSRALRLSYEYAEIEAGKSERSVEECLRRFHDNCPVLDNAGNTWKNNINQALTFGCEKSMTERIAASWWIGKSGLDTFVAELAGIEESNSSPLFQEITDEVKKGKIHLLPDRSGGSKGTAAEEKEKKDNEEQLVKKVKTVLMLLPTVVYVNPDLALDSCKSIAEKVDKEQFKLITGIDVKTLRRMTKLGIVTDYHDRCLLRYSNELRNP